MAQDAASVQDLGPALVLMVATNGSNYLFDKGTKELHLKDGRSITKNECLMLLQFNLLPPEAGKYFYEADPETFKDYRYKPQAAAAAPSHAPAPAAGASKGQPSSSSGAIA
jgi:hypothetical protein